jgi:hypothetical protein
MDAAKLFERYQELQRYVGWTADDAKRIRSMPGQIVVEAGMMIVVLTVAPTDLMIARWCACAARCGKCSQSVMPGALVAAGMNGPRYSAGASGFMSQVSMCNAPPLSQTMIVDFALPRDVRVPSSVPEVAAFARLNPTRPRPPATRNVRRSSE